MVDYLNVCINNNLNKFYGFFIKEYWWKNFFITKQFLIDSQLYYLNQYIIYYIINIFLFIL